MYLTAHQASVLTRVMTTLAEPHGEREIRERLGTLLLELLGAQYFASFVWDDRSATFGDCVPLHMDPANLRRYADHYQFRDPITHVMQRHRRAVRASAVLPRATLLRSEFFNDFLARDGLHWGINLYAWRGDRNIGDLRIWRDRRRSDFSDDEARLLDLIRPAFTAALARARDARRSTGRAVANATIGVEGLLSAREHEIAVLVATGLSDKQIAARLAISVTTVRTHLDHAFRKLDVDNRLMLVRRLAL